ncbi:MAG TPA: ATP-dependent DNA ligase [Mycobacteriales bacterium]|jgi:ATP-dependent DNA ligase
MLATTGPLPSGPGWAYELDWGGVRALVDVGPEVPGGLVVTGQLGEDLTTVYPELTGLAGVVRDALLDGEVVSFVNGRPSAQALEERSAPVTYLAFDVVRLYGVDLRPRPYRERRATLERLRLDDPFWTVPPAFDDGEATMAAAREFGLDGVVAKRLDAPYQDGVRATEWVNVPFTREQDFVLGGWRWGRGERAAGIGALLLGYHDRMRLCYAGQVETGFDTEALRDLLVRLAPLRRTGSPFDDLVPAEHRHDVVWCEPKLVARVAFGGWTRRGLVRHASYQGLAEGTEPREVHRA